MGIWNALEPGEPIGVAALSGPVDQAKLENGLAVLESWGHPVEMAANLTDRDGYLAGSDDARLDGFLGLLDRGVRMVVAARGGFGATRVMDRFPWDRLIANGVRLVGYSDLTAVLNPLASTVVQIHGPMVAAGLDRPGNANHLKKVLVGDLIGAELFSLAPGETLRHGHARGAAVGGNLSLLVSLLGTPWEPDFAGKVLFLEEVGEPPYRLDRLLTHLRSSASFGKVKALISGKLHACRPSHECASRWSELLIEAAPPGVPVVRGLPFGHGARNMAFPIGATVEIDTVRGQVIWSE
jgi:muramoyltetrapeptide carboxypeptidase